MISAFVSLALLRYNSADYTTSWYQLQCFCKRKTSLRPEKSSSYWGNSSPIHV